MKDFYYYHCSKCDKTVKKRPIKIGNTVYYPAFVTHKHGNGEYILQLLTLRELIQGRGDTY